MITVRDRVEALVNGSPYLREALAEGLINVSSLARRLQPQVQNDLMKDVSVDAVFMAIKRHAATLERSASGPDFGRRVNEFVLRTNVRQVTVVNSERLLTSITAALMQSRPAASSMLIFSNGQHEMTISASSDLMDDIEDWLQSERITSRRQDLTALSFPRQRGAGRQDDVQYPMQLLAWNGVPVVDVITTTNELTILLDDEMVGRAVTVLRGGSDSDKRSRRAETREAS